MLLLLLLFLLQLAAAFCCWWLATGVVIAVLAVVSFSLSRLRGCGVRMLALFPVVLIQFRFLSKNNIWSMLITKGERFACFNTMLLIVIGICQDIFIQPPQNQPVSPKNPVQKAQQKTIEKHCELMDAVLLFQWLHPKMASTFTGEQCLKIQEMWCDGFFGSYLIYWIFKGKP